MTSRAPLDQRIGHTDPSTFRQLSSVHKGAGTMEFGTLLGAEALSTNLIFLHRGIIHARSGIGQHFHNQCEEMFVILDGEAQFTVDGRTSTIKGPAAVPCRMGHAHGIYNATNTPVQWMNVNVGMTKIYDAFDLGDARVGAPLDEIPQFISMSFDRDLLKSKDSSDGGAYMSRRGLQPTIFSTSWAFVDHILIKSTSFQTVPNSAASAVYYVLSGQGDFRIGDNAAHISIGDAIPADADEVCAIRSAGEEPLECMVIGVAKDINAKADMMKTGGPFRN